MGGCVNVPLFAKCASFVFNVDVSDSIEIMEMEGAQNLIQNALSRMSDAINFSLSIDPLHKLPWKQRSFLFLHRR